MSDTKYKLLKLQHKIKSNSGKGFGIHSPFVFDFVTNVLQEKNAYYIYDEIEDAGESEKNNKWFKLFYRIVAYYDLRRILIVGQTPFNDFIRDNFDSAVDFINDISSFEVKEKYDFVYLPCDMFCKEFAFFEKNITFVVSNFFEIRKMFEEKYNKEQGLICIDLLDFGIIFKMEGFLNQYYKFFIN